MDVPSEKFPRGSGPSAEPMRWPPADVDAFVPAVARDVTCSLPEVVQKAGERIQELVRNLDRFTATESVEHRQVDKAGNLRSPQTRSFSYLVSIREVRPGILTAEELRDLPSEEFPAHLATMGLPSLALIFHPYERDKFRMSCEGLGEWQGQPAWQVRFEERPDRPAEMMVYRLFNGSRYAAKLKGRAWIAADSYQILRLEADLMEPIAAIPLKTQHWEVDYRPVQFPKRNLELWLPESADLYMDFRGQRFVRRHSLSEFVLFSVNINQKIADPDQP